MASGFIAGVDASVIDAEAEEEDDSAIAASVVSAGVKTCEIEGGKAAIGTKYCLTAAPSVSGAD